MYYSSFADVSLVNEVTSVDVQIKKCTEEAMYTRRLASNVKETWDLFVVDSSVHSPDYAVFKGRYDILHFLSVLDIVKKR